VSVDSSLIQLVLWSKIISSSKLSTKDLTQCDLKQQINMNYYANVAKQLMSYNYIIQSVECIVKADFVQCCQNY